jgi:RNA polymerase sigma factor (sigma-70 family)
MTALDDLTDGELLESLRSGRTEAYGVLFSRHRDAALRVARRQTPDRHLAEDAVNETFAAVLAAIQGGSGPVGVFGPYLISSVSRTVHRMNRRSMRETPVLESEIINDVVPETNTVVSEFDNTAAREAFRLLPDRWREVVWYLDIEEMEPREAAPMLGLSPNATVALHRRAKDGLRLGYLQQHVAAQGPAECKDMVAHIPAYVLGTLRKGRQAALEDHLVTCERCAAILLQIQEVGSLRGAILPALAVLPLSQLYPSSGQQATDPDTAGRKDALLTAFVAVMMASAVILVAFGFLAPTATESARTPQRFPEGPNSGSASPLPPPLAAQFDVLSHSKDRVTATLRISLPVGSLTSAQVGIDPGSGSKISRITASPANGWTCAITPAGGTKCETPTVPSSTLTLDFEMNRPICPAGTPLSLLVSVKDREPIRQTWENPCISN